jgi:hypothetical protein
MPDSPAGSAAFLNGEEIVNDARTLAYLNAGFGPKRLSIDGGCACPRIRELIECGSDPYESPMSDPAPWYDSSVPESADFAGFLTVEFEGLGSTYTRESIDKITGGAVLGRLRPTARTLHWRGYLFGRSDCAVRYGLSWMAANLKGTNCSCTGEDLDLMVCCPELTVSPPVSGVGCDDLPPKAKPDLCPPFTQPDAFRLLKNVGLLAGPTIISQRRIGCKSSCGSSTCTGDDDTVIIEVEFSLLAGNPYLYGCPVCLCAEQPFPINVDPECNWLKVPPGDPALCGDNLCPPDVDCTLLDNGCPPAVLPVLPAYEDPCFCDPIDPVQFCCSIPADSFGQFFEGAPVIDIFSGSKSMRATTIRFFANPQGLDCCDIAEDPCHECDSIQIKFIPANSTLTVDGVTRTVSVQCPGSTEPIIADYLTVTPFSWPILQCVDFCICIETEGAQVATNATITVSVVPREM